ncbi:hypothetical protein JCM15765_00570 [Paradesulfitobacterium aromaticivorans]
MQAIDIAAAMLKELERANKNYPGFNSAHEGYAVILEELDELWAEVKKKHPDKDRLRDEAIQVGAMAMKFVASMEHGWRLGPLKEEISQAEFEIKCSQCQYNVMTAQEIQEHGSDPCETCSLDHRNWKPKEAKS